MEKKYNIVLDIDNTLCYSFEDNNYMAKNYDKLKKRIDLKNRLYKFGVEGYDKTIYGIKRPYMDEFIDFCFDYFNMVCIWSAGAPQYVKHMIPVIFNKRSPHLVYSYSDLPKTSTTTNYHKPLLKIANDINGLNNIITLDNTFIIDDRKDNFVENVNNGILISEYKPSGSLAGLVKNDIALLNIMNTIKDDKIKSLIY